MQVSTLQYYLYCFSAVSQHSTGSWRDSADGWMFAAYCFALNNCDIVFFFLYCFCDVISDAIQYSFSSQAHEHRGRICTNQQSCCQNITTCIFWFSFFLTPEVWRWLYSWHHLIICLIIAMPYGHYGSDSELRLHWAALTSSCEH